MAAILTSIAVISACSKLDDPSLQPAFDASIVEQPVFKPAVPANAEKNVFFGDLHIHTGLSTDAYVFGVRSLPEDAYIFAKGGTIKHGAGYSIKISRPLDFIAVTDHSEYMGQARQADLKVPTTERSLRDILLNDSAFGITKAWLLSTNFIRVNGFGYGEDTVNRAVNKSAWQMTIDAAERH